MEEGREFGEKGKHIAEQMKCNVVEKVIWSPPVCLLLNDPYGTKAPGLGTYRKVLGTKKL